MSTRHLAEQSVNMMIDYIQSNIAGALSGVRNYTGPARSIDVVTTEPPRQYFLYAPIKGYRTPAVLVILTDFDFRPEQKGANHINAKAAITVACLLEERDLERLTIKSFRYLDAFHEVLGQAEITDPVANVKLIVIVKRATLTPEYTNAGEDPQGIFRKELHLECDVEHYSNL